MLSAFVAALVGLGLVIAAMVGSAPHTASPPPVKPYSYSTTVHHDGQLLTCIMNVDSNGNGSLNNCRHAS
jgi:hypothetical protein